MKVLVIGGTGLSGPHIVRELIDAGHDVTVFNRGKREAPFVNNNNVTLIIGDKANLLAHRRDFEALRPDAVIHMMALTKEDASIFIKTFRDLTERAVVISSSDVYLPYGRLHRTEPGPMEPLPLTEESRLRQKLGPEGEAYDKLGVEATLRGSSDLHVTVIRYPAVYGPGDRQRRFYEYVRRMADKRPAIILGTSESQFRFTHVYAENAAHAVVLAATLETVPSGLYNVAERDTPTWIERIEQLRRVTGWQGEIVIVPDEQAPAHQRLATQPDLSQGLVIDDGLIRRKLAYSEVVSLDEGMRRTVDWLLTHPPEAEPDYAAEDALLAELSGS